MKKSILAAIALCSILAVSCHPEEGMTIDDYLALRPFVNASLLFQLSEIPENLPLSTSFTVDIELADGKHITSATPAVTIE